VPPQPSHTAKFISSSTDQTVNFGARLGSLLGPGDVICLNGDLGAGKTALARGIGQGWGALEAVTSPTFTLIHEHHRQQDAQRLHHVDCYRLQSTADAWSTGLDDMLYGDGIIVIEWPERIASLLPAERLWIALTPLDESQRQINMQATGTRYSDLLRALAAMEI
jgi:tRNA threonylcarbamoyladenosine biosynthesis protein TsaE